MITKELFTKYDWQSVFGETERTKCGDFIAGFASRYKAATAEGNKEAAGLYKLLHGIALLHFPRGDPPSDSLQVGWINGEERSFLPEDLTDEEVSILAEIAPTVENVEFRARLFHVIWMRNRDYQAALLASEYYLESARNCADHDNWIQLVERLWLAYRIAKTLGASGKKHVEKVVSFIKGLIRDWSKLDTGFGLLKLIEILLKYKDLPDDEYAILAENVARRYSGNPSLAREYWELAVRCHQLTGNTEESKAAKMLAAETYIEEAKKKLAGENPSYLVASKFIEDAIVAFRRIEGCTDRARSLVDLHRDYSKKALKEMKSFKFAPDFQGYAEIVSEVQRKVRGMSLEEAIRALCIGIKIPSRARLESQAKENIQNFPLSHLIGETRIDASGRTVAKRPGAIRETDPGWDSTVEAQIRQLWNFENEFNVALQIVPALQQITLQHFICEQHLSELVANNPVVPRGHEILFRKGLFYGFQFKFAEAAHILVPQLENSIRYILETNGVRTTSHTDDGIQDVITLDVLLRDPKYRQHLVRILGEDVVFDLECLLVSRFGYNFRNKLSHGLLGYEEASSSAAVYVWWHVLRLCMIPILNEKSASYEEPELHASGVDQSEE